MQSLKSEEELSEMLDQSIKIKMWTNTIFDFVQLLLAIATAIYLFFNKKSSLKIAWLIKLQMAFFITQSLMFTIRNFWQLIHKQYEIDFDLMPEYIFICYLIADFCFWA